MIEIDGIEYHELYDGNFDLFGCAIFLKEQIVYDSLWECKDCRYATRRGCRKHVSEN